MTKIYVTKWAQTQGIIEMNARAIDEEKEYAHVGEAGRIESHLFFRKEWHLTRKEAVQDARRRLLAKQASLKKQMTKLHDLDVALAEEQRNGK